jgi:hypothetical protein
MAAIPVFPIQNRGAELMPVSEKRQLKARLRLAEAALSAASEQLDFWKNTADAAGGKPGESFSLTSTMPRITPSVSVMNEVRLIIHLIKQEPH